MHAEMNSMTTIAAKNKKNSDDIFRYFLTNILQIGVHSEKTGIFVQMYSYLISCLMEVGNSC